MPSQRESFLVHDILRAWGAHPSLRIWRQNTGVGWFKDGKPARQTDPGAYAVRFGVPGQGDIGGILAGGRRLEIECKTERGRQSDEQRSFQIMIERFGGLYVLARSLEDVDRVLLGYGIIRAGCDCTIDSDSPEYIYKHHPSCRRHRCRFRTCLHDKWVGAGMKAVLW